MSKKNNDKPWDRHFDDDRDSKGNLSRVASKKKEKGNSLFVAGLTIVLILIIASPVMIYAVSQSQSNKPEDANEIVVSSSKKKVNKTASSKKTASKKTSSKKKSESTKKADSKSQSTETAQSQAPAQQATQQPSAAQSSAPQTASSQEAANASSSSAGAEYYTVKSGEGLYRIAVNHGLTLNQLLEMNGLSSGSEIHPGTTLRVK